MWKVVFITDLQGQSGATAQSRVLAKAFSSRNDVEFILCNTPPSRIKHHEVSVVTEIDGTKSIYPTRSLYEAIKRENPHIVITNVFDLHLAREAQEIARDYIFIPRVGINLIELSMTARYQVVIPHVMKFLLRADHLIACSESGKKTFQSMGCKDVTVIPTGIDPEMFKLWECSDPTIGILGRVMPIKNHLTLLQAFKQLQKDVPDSELAVVGEGNLVSIYEDAVKILGLEGQVGFYSYIDDPSKFFHEIRVLALPSFSEYLPQCVLEAYASGIPCVVSEAGWGDSFQACLKARPDCPWEWAEKLRVLLTNEKVWWEVRKRQLRELRGKFDVKRIVNQYVKLFGELKKRRLTAAFGEPLHVGEEPPKVSVIVPVKNRKRLIKRCLDSILAEGYPNLEVIVVDGKSTDGTVEVLEEYSRKYPQVKYISEPDRNQSEAKNKGLKMATGHYITFQDSDDEVISGKLKLLSEFLEKNRRYFAVFGNTVPRSLNGETYPVSKPPPEISFETLCKNNYIGSGSIMLRNSPEVRFDENLRFGEDYKLWLTLIKKYNIAYLDRNAYFWNVDSGTQISSKVSSWKEISKKRVREVREHYAGSPYDEDMRIAVFCSVFGSHPFGGPAIQGYHVCQMLYMGRKFFRMFYEFEPHPAYFRPREVLRPWSDFNSEDFNVFYVMSGDVTGLNRMGIKPIIGSNHIPNSAPPHVLEFFEGDARFKFLWERQLEKEKRLIKLYKGKFWLAQSTFQRDEYRRVGMTEPTYLAPNPIDTQLFKRREEYGESIVWSGNAGWAKGLHRFLKPIAEAFPNEKFRCLSGKKLGKGIGANVEYIIGKTTFEVAKILQKAKIFASTSFTENQPLAVLEAMACELPVIAFRTSGIPEIIQDEETGLLVKLGDLDEYKEKLRWLLDNEKLRRRLGKNARKYVVENFSYGVCLDKYMELFQRYLRDE